MKTLKVEAVYPMDFQTFEDVAEHLLQSRSKMWKRFSANPLISLDPKEISGLFINTDPL